MKEHLTAGITEYGDRGVVHTPITPPSMSPQWDVLASLWEGRAAAQGGAVEVAVGPTGYLDQSKHEDFVEALTAVVDCLGRKGVAVRLRRVADGLSTLEILFQRYTHPGPVTLGTRGGCRIITSGVFDSEAQNRFADLCSGGCAYDASGNGWSLDP